jgi:uncharacterized protein
MSATFELSVLSGAFVVCRFEPSTAVPVWALQPAGFTAVTRTDDELSIICREDAAPEATATSARWRALKVHGPFPLETIGVLSALSHSLADGGVSLLAVSTHDTDYLFVQARDLAHAVRALRRHGHTVHTSPP